MSQTNAQSQDFSHAEALVAAVRSLGPDQFQQPGQPVLKNLITQFEQVGSKEAYDLLAGPGISRLVEIFDRPDIHPDLKLHLLKIFAMYHSEPGAARMIQCARAAMFPEAFMWAVVFQCLHWQHPLTLKICNALRDPLPQAFIAVAYLDLANILAGHGKLPLHPFDSSDGIARLRSYLTAAHSRQFTFALSAAAALPYLKNQARGELLSLAMNHPDTRVRLCAAWASAKLGDDGGAQSLSRACLDPRTSQAAWGYLEDINHQELIPIDAQRPDFRAMAEMCDWLGHPHQFGRPPNDIELFDSRELDWPPTNDRRRVWLFKYRYRWNDPAHPDESRVGMVGSFTFSFFDQPTVELGPVDIYALHCCQELQWKKDPRAPEKPIAAAGRALLGI